MDNDQRRALAASVTAISKELCPPSTFTVRRDVIVEGKPVQVHLIPTSPAAQMLRREPSQLGDKLKEMYLHNKGAELRALLTHVEPEGLDYPWLALDDAYHGTAPME